MTPISIQSISGMILAGGLGTRMGSANKGLQQLYGKPMLAHVIDCIEPQVASIVLNVNHNLDEYALFQKPLVQDIYGDYVGPLAGIHAGLVHCKTAYLFCAPCDVPLLPKNVVVQLALALCEHDADIAVACTMKNAKIPSEVQSHPIVCLMKTSLRSHLEHFLQQGGRKVQAWQTQLQTQQVIFDNEAAFYNFNHVEELLLANENKKPN